MGADPGAESTQILDGALDLAQRVADAAEQGRFDVVDSAAAPGGCSSATTRRRGPRASSEPRLRRGGESRAEPRRASRVSARSSPPTSTRSPAELIGAELLVDGVGGRSSSSRPTSRTIPASHAYRGRDPAQRRDVRSARPRLRLPLLRDALVPEPRLRPEGRERRTRARARADPRAREMRARRGRRRGGCSARARADSARRSA